MPRPHAPWHALLAPLPAGAVPHRRAVVPPEPPSSPVSAAIAGWSSVGLELSAGAAGLRIVQVLVDHRGQPLSASDHMLYRSAHPHDRSAPAHIEQESIGCRIDPDGSFRGTCWRVVGPEPAEGEEPQWTMAPRPPTAEEIATLRSLVAELLLRGPIAR